MRFAIIVMILLYLKYCKGAKLSLMDNVQGERSFSIVYFVHIQHNIQYTIDISILPTPFLSAYCFRETQSDVTGEAGHATCSFLTFYLTSDQRNISKATQPPPSRALTLHPLSPKVHLLHLHLHLTLLT